VIPTLNALNALCPSCAYEPRFAWLSGTRSRVGTKTQTKLSLMQDTSTRGDSSAQKLLPSSGVRLKFLRPMLAALLGCVVGNGAARAQPFSLVLSNKWSVAPDSRYYLPGASGGQPRSLAINRTTGNVLVPSLQGGSNHIAVLNGGDGADLGSLSGGGVVTATGFAALLGIGVADDGAIYACNGDNASGQFKVYRWSAEDLTGAAAPAVAFGGDNGNSPGPVKTRIGDSFCVSGAGTRALLVASGSGSPYFTVFTTADGTNFRAHQFPIPATVGAGGFNRTLAWDGANQAFWGGAYNSPKLYYTAFNLADQTATVLSNLTLSASMGMCAARAVEGVTVLAGIQDNGLEPSASRRLLVYDLKNLGAIALGGNVPFPSGGLADANTTGQADIGAGMVVALSTQGGIVALNYFLQAASAPAITQAPVGAVGVFPAYTLSVGASGAQPLRYQWLASSQATNLPSTFTNIPGAVSAAYTLPYPVTNYFAVVVTNAQASVTSAPVFVSLLPAVVSTVVTQLWRLPPGANGYPYLSPADNATRGIGYDPLSQRVVVSGMSGGAAIHLLDADTGADLGVMDLSQANLGGGTFAVDQVGVADDGAVFAGNLALPGQTFNLNYWPAPRADATAYNAYNDALSSTLANTGDRWGDALAVRGAGVAAQVLLGSRSGANVALLTTADGSNFVANVIPIALAPPGFAANGIAFGDGNTLWAKADLGDLYQVRFDPVSLTGAVVFDYSAPAQIPAAMVGVAVDPARGILAGIVLSDTPQDLQLFQLTGGADSPVLFDQAFFASANLNGNANAAIALKFPRAYGLDVNNGLVALSYGIPPTAPPQLIAPPASQTVYTNDPNVALSVSVSGSLPLYFQWRRNGANLPGATAETYRLHYPPPSASGYYDVVVRNIAGALTSAPPALLTVMTPASSGVVTQLWAVAAGARPYLDGYSYAARGLAWDPLTGTALVADHDSIYVLDAANGADLFSLNTLGLPSGYFTLDQIVVAEDGAVFAGNLSLDGTDFALTRWDSVSANASLFAAFGPGDPGNGSGDRWGDTLSARGAGARAELLAGSYRGTNAVLFTTSDGLNFTPTLLAVSGVPAGFAGLGLAFGAGDTFWAKSPDHDLYWVAFDRIAGTAAVKFSYPAGPQIDLSLAGIGVDASMGLLGGVAFTDTPNDLQLYLLSGNANAPALVDQVFFPTLNLNGQYNAATVLKAGRAFSLDVNNGLVALSYGRPATPPALIVAIAYRSGSGATLTWRSFAGRSYQVLYQDALGDPVWKPIGPSISGDAATVSYQDVSAGGAARYYRVQSF